MRPDHRHARPAATEDQVSILLEQHATEHDDFTTELPTDELPAVEADDTDADETGDSDDDNTDNTDSADDTGEGTTFADLGLAPQLLSELVELGHEIPTPIQAEAIRPLIDGRDLLGQAATGTGKTAAFALPMLQRLADGRAGA